MILDKQKALPLPDLHLHFRVEKNGIILHEHDEPGHSFTWNAWNAFAMFSMYSGGFGSGAHEAGNLVMRQYGSDSWDTSSGYQIFNYGATSDYAGRGYYNTGANANFGILVGTSDNAFSTTNFALHGLIAHGNGASQLYYQAMGASVVAYDSGTKKFSNTFTRVYNNNSGGAITVKEAGLCSYGYNNCYYLLARDVLGTPVAVPDGAQLTVTYVITSQDFTNCFAGVTYGDIPALGTAGMGGYSGPAVTYFATAGAGADMYMYIVSPIGGEYTSQWHSASQYTGSEEANDGLAATEENITASLAHTTGVTDYRTATSIADWYVPARYEMARIFTSAMQAALPGGHEVSDESYWTSTRAGRDARYQNPVTGAANIAYQTISLKIRLVRRILISDWVAD